MRLDEHTIEGNGKRVHDLIAKFGDVLLFRSNEKASEVMNFTLHTLASYDDQEPRFLLVPHDQVISIKPGNGDCSLTTHVENSGEKVLLVVRREKAQLAICLRAPTNSSTTGVLKTLGWAAQAPVAQAA